jgi:integrase
VTHKFPKPFFRTARNCWFVQLGKQQIKLHPDEGEAMKLYHELMAARGKQSAAASLPPTTGLAAAEVFDKYLDWCSKHRRPRTYAWYKDHIQSFLASLADPRIAAVNLRPFHVTEWLDRHPSWGACQRRGAIIAIQRPYNWAAKLGYIESNPIAHVEKPAAVRREAFVSPEEWATIRDSYRDGDPFRDLLEFCWATGCRPQEAKAIEARHVSPDRTTILFPPAEAKGGRRWRRILLEGRAAEIIARLLAKRPAGRLFLNARGKPWTASNMSNRFDRLRTKLGVKYFAYAFRHGFATRMLTSGVDHLTVAELLGHTNGTMLATVYQHLDRQGDHLRNALRRAAAGDAA